MSELVLLHNNEPMTTSLAIAEGTENTHESVIKLVRKYVEDLQEFGTLGFEIRKSGGLPTEFAYLNEPQSTLLITYMRNSEIVRRFKIALVKAFYELRNAVLPAPTFTAVDHRADVLVSADRTFRAILRTARAAGARLPDALAKANEITVRETGIDMLAEIGPVERPPADLADPIADGIGKWAESASDSLHSMAEILRQAFGVEEHHRDYWRLAVQAGHALREVGFISRKVRRNGPLRTYWERKRSIYERA
jgi:phage regulator Rha-like protein